MKKSLFVAALMLAASTAFAAPPTVTFVTSLAIGGTTTAPVDIAIRNDKVYVAGFTNRVITEVTDILNVTPTVTNVVDVNAETTWEAAARGPQCITFDSAGNLHIFAHAGGGAVNAGVWWIYNSSFVQTQETVMAANRVCSGLIRSNGNALVGRAASSTPQIVDPAGTQQSLGNLVADNGARAPWRDFVQVGNSVYYITTNAAATFGHSVAKIADISDLSVAGDTPVLVSNLGSVPRHRLRWLVQLYRRRGHVGGRLRHQRQRD